MRLERFRRLRYARPLAVTPTQSARVFVAFAGMGATPVNRRAGNATKLPPPATALIAPPNAPAKNRKIAVWICKQALYHVCAQVLHLPASSVSGLFIPASISLYLDCANFNCL